MLLSSAPGAQGAPPSGRFRDPAPPGASRSAGPRQRSVTSGASDYDCDRLVTPIPSHRVTAARAGDSTGRPGSQAGPLTVTVPVARQSGGTVSDGDGVL